MFKKCMVFIMLSILSIFMLLKMPTAFATMQTDSGDYGLWHVQEDNRVYIHKRVKVTDYNNFYTDILQGGYEVPSNDTPNYDIESDSDHYLNFGIIHMHYANGSTLNRITNPDPEKYKRFYVEMKTSDGLDRVVFEAENANNIFWSLNSKFWSPSGQLIGGRSFDPYLGIRIYQDSFDFSDELGRVDQSEFSLVYGSAGKNQAVNTVTYSVRMYWESAEVVDPGEPSPENPTPWLTNLPNMTEGNPQNIDGQWGNVTGFNYNSTTKLFNADVIYDGKSYPIIDAHVLSDDDSFLQRTKKAYYFTQDGQKFLYLNFSNITTSFMLKNHFEELDGWEGHAVWNLTTGKVNVMEQLKVFQYLKFTNDNELMAYFYIIDTPVDDLISVTSNVAYREWKPTWFGLGPKEPGPIQNKIITASAGETNSIRPSWVKPMYQTSYFVAASSLVISGYALVKGGVPWFGLGVAAVGLITGGLLQYADDNEWLNYDIAQIQKLAPNQQIRSEMSEAYFNAYGETLPSTVGQSLYRLSYGQFEQNDLQIIKEKSDIITIVFETDGITHTYQKEQIDGEWTGPATEEPENIDGILPIWALWLITIAIGLFALANVKSIILTIKNNPIITIIVVIGIIYALTFFNLL